MIKPEYNYYPIAIAVPPIDIVVAANSPAVVLSDDNIKTVGGASILQSNFLQSTNFVKGFSGWRIDAAGNAFFQTITAGGYIQVFKQDDIPTSLHINDIWIDTDDSNKYYIAAKVGATTIAVGEWELSNPASAWSTLADDDGNKPTDNADVTSDNTADDTTNVNSSPSTRVQPRAEDNYTKLLFKGHIADSLLETVTNCTITRFTAVTGISNSTAGYWKLTTNGLGVVTRGISVNQYGWGNNFDLVCRVEADNGSIDTVELIGANEFWGLMNYNKVLSPTLGTNGLTLTSRHAGFITTRDGKLYATVGNNTTQFTTEITGITFTNKNTYRLVFTAGTDVKFYVNDVLKATITNSDITLPAGYISDMERPDIHFQGRCGRNEGKLIRFWVANNYSLTIT